MNLKRFFSKNKGSDLPNIYENFEVGDNIIFNNDGVKHKAIIVKINNTTAFIDYGDEIIDVDFKYIRKEE